MSNRHFSDDIPRPSPIVSLSAGATSIYLSIWSSFFPSIHLPVFKVPVSAPLAQQEGKNFVAVVLECLLGSSQIDTAAPIVRKKFVLKAMGRSKRGA